MILVLARAVFPRTHLVTYHEEVMPTLLTQLAQLTQLTRLTRARLAAILALILMLSLSTGTVQAVDTPVGGVQLTGKGKIVNLGEGSDPLPRVKAKTWLIANMDTGDILAAKGPHILRAPASTLKTLTALTLMPVLDPTTVVKAKKKAVNTYGTKVGVRKGKPYSIEDLFYALLLPSANDAAISLAQANGGVAQTLDQMNATAQSLGALDTVAKTPNGLDAPGQVSSAYDLAVIGRAAMQLPEFTTIVATKSHDFPVTKKKTVRIFNTNRLLTDGFKGTTGIKTGFTTNAGRTLIASAKRQGTNFIMVGMGIKEASADAAAKLITWAAANQDTLTPIGTLNTEMSNTSGASDADATTTVVSNTRDLPAPTATSTAGSSLDGLAIGWIILFIAILVFALFAIKSAFSNRRGRHTVRGRITLE